MHETEDRVRVHKRPAWLSHALMRFVELVRLPANWNSYGALPMRPALMAVAIEFLFQNLAWEELPEPIITPTNRGGTVFEWHMREIDLEIEVQVGGRYHLSYEDLTTGAVIEEEFHHDRRRLNEVLDELARRKAGKQATG